MIGRKLPQKPSASALLFYMVIIISALAIITELMRSRSEQDALEQSNTDEDANYLTSCPSGFWKAPTKVSRDNILSKIKLTGLNKKNMILLH